MWLLEQVLPQSKEKWLESNSGLITGKLYCSAHVMPREGGSHEGGGGHASLASQLLMSCLGKEAHMREGEDMLH